MRFGEILSSATAALTIALLLFAPQRRRVIAFLARFTSLFLLLHVATQGAHWQAYPLYAAGLVLLVGWAGLLRWPRWIKVSIAASAAGLLVLFLALSWLVPMFHLPQPTGPFAVGTHIAYFVDQNRPETEGPSPSGHRELIVQEWYPAQPTPSSTLAAYQRRKEVTFRGSYRSILKTNSFEDADPKPGGPYPVLLYNPGWMGERTEGTYQMEELASQGYFVVAIDHTFYGGLVEFPGGRVTDSHEVPELGSFDHSTVEQQMALGSHYVHIMADDDVFVLNQIEAMNQDPASRWYHRLDMSRVGAMGFSIGGAVAAQTAYQDPRVKAALNLDGWTFGDAGSKGLAKPWMVLYEDRAQTVPRPEELTSGSESDRRFKQANALDYGQVLRGLQQNGGYLLFIAGTRHVDFTDRALFSPLISRTGGGTLPPARTHAIVNAYTLAFFDHVLLGKQEPLLESSPSPFSEVDFQAFPKSAASEKGTAPSPSHQ